jgi:hypothetical protein
MHCPVPGSLINLRLYRLAFAPTLLTVVVIMFSLDGVPAPVEPAAPSASFEGDRAEALARQVLELAPERQPGSVGDLRVADFVRERFDQIPAGTISEQSLDGEQGSERNVVLTLVGESEETLVVVAPRDAAHGPGAATSAAATGLLLELATSLAIADRQDTFVLASTSGDGTSGRSVVRLLDALPERDSLAAVVVISQPGARVPRPPHVIASSSAANSGPIQLERTAERAVQDQARQPPERPGAFTQLARLAIPSGIGAQAPLIADGVEAVAISSAGERPLAEQADQPDDLSAQTLDAFGRSVQATVGALDTASTELEHGPGAYVRVGDNLLAGWTVALLALALILPALVASIDSCARAGRRRLELRFGLAWAAARGLPLVGALAMLYALALVGAVPRPGFPFDPVLYGLGVGAAIALAAIVAVAIASAALLRRLGITAAGAPATALPGLGVIGALAALAIWFANPYLGLLVAPAAHVWLLVALPGRSMARPVLVVVAAALACLPPIAALAAVAAALDLGGDAPWTFAIMVADGQLGLAVTAPACFLGGALMGAVALAIVRAPAARTALSSVGSRRQRRRPAERR